MGDVWDIKFGDSPAVIDLKMRGRALALENRFLRSEAGIAESDLLASFEDIPPVSIGPYSGRTAYLRVNRSEIDYGCRVLAWWQLWERSGSSYAISDAEMLGGENLAGVVCSVRRRIDTKLGELPAKGRDPT